MTSMMERDLRHEMLREQYEEEEAWMQHQEDLRDPDPLLDAPFLEEGERAVLPHLPMSEHDLYWAALLDYLERDKRSRQRRGAFIQEFPR